MDKGLKEQRFGWLPKEMPGVAKLIADKRTEVGSDWVNECWRHGVLQRWAGWFWAGEGALSVGTMWDDPGVIALATNRITTQSLLVLRAKGAP